jgi:NADPH:quinone reductase-like Zn-dependent oxidoreductase
MYYVFSFIKFTVFFPIQEGDRVMVHTGTPGLQTEFVCVEASDCTVIPESMSFNEAAAFPINYLTAYFCLFDIGNLRSSQTVLIPSAAGKK